MKDVRARAGNSGSSTEVASKVLADHFSAPQTAGFLSLEALNCLVCGDQDMVEPMVKMALPSTLIKTIYLFYDLPVPSSAEFKASIIVRGREVYTHSTNFGASPGRLGKNAGSIHASCFQIMRI